MKQVIKSGYNFNIIHGTWRSMSAGIKVIFTMILLLVLFQANAQQKIKIDDAIALGKNNLQYAINKEQINKSQAQVKTAGALPKTGLFAENEDMRPGDNRGILKVGLSQSMAWPGLYKAQKALYSEQMKYHQANAAVLDAAVKRDIRTVYYQLWYLQDKQQLFIRLDSIYRSLNNAAILKVKTGDSPGLDSISANVRWRELEAWLQQTGSDIQIQQQLMMQLLNTTDTLLPLKQPLEKLPVPFAVDSLHPVLLLQQQNVNIASAGINVVKNENKPEFSGRFFSQRLYGMRDPYTGFSVTAAFPLLGLGAYKSKIQTAKAEVAMQQKQFEYEKQVLNTQQSQMRREVEKNRRMLQFYESTGLKQAEEVIKAASLAYRAGEISFAELSQFLTQAIDIQRNYLDNLNTYNHSVIQYNYFINQ